MSIDDPLKKEIERLQQNSKLLQTATGLTLLPRHSFSDLLAAAKPPGGLVFDTTANKLIRSLQESQRGTLFGAVVDAARALQENRTFLHNFVRSAYGFPTTLARAVEGALQPFVQVVRAAEQLRQEIRTTLEPVQRIREALASLPTEQFSAFQQSFVGFADSFRLQWDHIVEKPVYDLFTKLGFTGLESHLTRSELLYVLRLSKKKKGTAAVKEYVFRKFRRDKYRLLNRTVRGWWRVPYMNKRKKAIRAAINAHKKRHFELAIPALLPLIDGLAAEIADGIPNLKTGTICAKEVATMYNAAEGEVWSECVEQVVYGLVYKDYSFKTAKRPPSSVNRHGILHGRVVDYGSELNSYRVIFLLDVMVNIAHQKSKNATP
jgi:hypothetical protein